MASETLPLEQVTAAFFREHLDAAFTIGAGEATGHALRLSAVEVLGMRQTLDREPFRLQFAGSPALVLPQATYSLLAKGVGALDIFIVPIGRNADETTYEAIFT